MSSLGGYRFSAVSVTQLGGPCVPQDLVKIQPSVILPLLTLAVIQVL